MNDNLIIELYFKRSEDAITQSNLKYGKYCNTIAYNILGSAQDSEECVNDTWLKAWNAIPPERPSLLSAFFAKITRNLAIDKWRKSKRHTEASVCIDELAECIGSDELINDKIELSDLLGSFTKLLSADAKKYFIMRYWYAYPIKTIAKLCSVNVGAVKMSLKRSREKLREILEKEGII